MHLRKEEVTFPVSGPDSTGTAVHSTVFGGSLKRAISAFQLSPRTPPFPPDPPLFGGVTTTPDL